ncbi:hypothetical protein ABZ885_35480, partial [Kitasatospora sp. NPDC047058]
ASGWMNRAAVPVVLATVTRPPPRSAPAQSRVVRRLLAQVRGEPVPAAGEVLATELVVRASSA